MELFAVGKCWKRDGWIISVYLRLGDRYATVKLKKTATPTPDQLEVLEGDLRTVMEERSIVRRFGED